MTFSSRQAAEAFAEPPDVQAGDVYLKAFDSEGKPIRFGVEPPDRWWRPSRTVLNETGEMPQPEKLRALIVEALDDPGLRDKPLEQLVNEAVGRFGYS
jgi:hypothetical protein